MPTLPYTHKLRVAHLNARKPTELDLQPGADERAAIAASLGLIELPQVRLTARIAAAGHQSWELTGQLTARVVQPCVVTLAPVETAIDEPVRRVYSPHAEPDLPEGSEIEMTDDEVEPLGQTIDAGGVLVEALALALPLYPRAEGAALPETGDAAGEDEAVRLPFAGLAELLAGKARDDTN